MAKPVTKQYSIGTLREVIALHPDGVSVNALIHAFHLAESDIKPFKNDLQALINEGFSKSDKRGKYRAIKPMSDIVVARVSAFLKDGNIQLSIQGTPENFDLTASLTKNHAKKVFQDKKLKIGDLLAIRTSRHATVELKARPIGIYKRHKSPTLVGHFKVSSSGRKFVACDTSIQTRFTAAGKIPKKVDARVSFCASIPPNLDPFDPVLVIREQKWDPDTGIPISVIIAKKHGLQTRHSEDANAEAKQAIDLPILENDRRDLRHEKIFVVDPPNAYDHDDGILIERTRDGFRTLVGVSDVAYYVRPQTNLDIEARNRGNTVYFPDRAIHIFPKKLVHHMSLTDGKEKPVIYVEQFWDEYGQKISEPVIGTGIIASQKNMTYGQFEDFLYENEYNAQPYTDLGNILIPNTRFEQGVTFDIGGIDTRAPYAQALVSTMMIEANSAIAEYLSDQDVRFLSRIHSAKEDEFSYFKTKEQLRVWGYSCPDRPQDMNVFALNEIISTADLRGEKRLVEEFLRTTLLQNAVYSTIQSGHFGLNREHYTHATSPIRRYADLFVQRAIHSSFGNDDFGLSPADVRGMNATATHLNTLQDLNRRIVRDTHKHFAVRDLQRLEGHTLRANLGKIDARTVEIILPQRFGLRNYVDVQELPEGWLLGMDNKSLIFNNKHRLLEGTPLSLRITAVHPERGTWDFDRLSPRTAEFRRLHENPRLKMP